MTAQLPLPDSAPPERRVARCRMCSRPLLDAESRLYQLGPECRREVPPAPRRFEVEQDELPGLDG